MQVRHGIGLMHVAAWYRGTSGSTFTKIT